MIKNPTKKEPIRTLGFTLPYNNNLLLTEREGRTGEYLPSVVLYGHRCAPSVLPRPRANIPRYGPRARLVTGYYLARLIYNLNNFCSSSQRLNLFVARFQDQISKDHRCNGCGVNISDGTYPSDRKYHCLNCIDVDFCSDCYMSEYSYLWYIPQSSKRKPKWAGESPFTVTIECQESSQLLWLITTRDKCLEPSVPLVRK